MLYRHTRVVRKCLQSSCIEAVGCVGSTMWWRSTLPKVLGIISLCLLSSHNAYAKSPPGTITFVSAGQAGLMKGIGVLNPHAYRPNEFVVQNWVYEGLVHYGPGGKIIPALADSWEVRNHGHQQDIIFNLRR